MVPIDDDQVMLATGGLFAPTIRYHRGRFYVVCTNVIHIEGANEDQHENFIVSTTDIYSDEWSDPVRFDFNGIDTCLFFDDESGKVFIHGSASPGPMTKIHLFEIDLNTGKKLSAEKKIWDGTGGIYPEGPHLYKKDGYYYLVISEGGTFDDHCITVARSKDIWGPYDAFENNPILTAKGTANYIQYTGHCDLFEDEKGQWWGVCLAVRKDKTGRHIMGRETFLTPGDWPTGGWPSLKQVIPNPVLKDGTVMARAKQSIPFQSKSGVDYLYIRNAKLEDHQVSIDGKTITIVGSKADISQWKEPVSFVGIRQRKLDAQASVKMILPDHSSGVKAGLALYKDEHRFARVFYDVSASAMVLEVLNRAKSISKVQRHDFKQKDAVQLRMKYTETSFVFSYSGVQESWNYFDAVDTLDLTGPDFVGPVIGVFATSEAENAKVQFDNLQVDA
jgi:beta-xylosidase